MIFVLFCSRSSYCHEDSPKSITLYFRSSKVGYGLVFPGTSATARNTRECTAITIVTCLESFVGILFASFWGAIFFSKVTRLASYAQVNFSDVIIVKYGTGITGVDPDEEEDSSEDEEKASSEFYHPSMNRDTIIS